MAINTVYAQEGDALSNKEFGKDFVLKTTIDCSENNITSGDVVRLWDIPAGYHIRNVIANVTTAEGGTLTIDVGDYLQSNDSAVDADGYLDGANGNSAAVNQTSVTSSLGYYAGKLYTAASYIGVLFNNAADAAVIDVIAIGTYCG